jgi:hypothetical protein
MHESRFICKENLFSKICSAVASFSNAKSQHSATEYLRPEIAVAVAASSVRQILQRVPLEVNRRVGKGAQSSLHVIRTTGARAPLPTLQT